MIGAAQMFIIANSFIADKPIDPSILWVLALIVAVIAPLKAYLGVRDSSTAQFSVRANQIDDSVELRQFRRIDDDQIISRRVNPPDSGATPMSPPPSLPPAKP